MEPSIAELLDKYLGNSLSDAERGLLAATLADPRRRAELEALIDAQFRNDEIGGLSAPGQGTAAFEKLLRSMGVGAAVTETPVVELYPAQSRSFRRIAMACVVLILLGASWFFLLRPRHKQDATFTAARYKNDVAPGHNGAVLHLSNGSSIVLDSAHDGTVARQGGVEAVKTNGELKYTGQATGLVYNSISTDRGRQWQLTLPDGTRVWLNAASSIRYPLSFTGPEREVQVTGETYFEVAHNSRQPFKVIAGNQIIRDIGTAFDINTYPDEPEPKTTLAEGAATVNGVRLRPGQQASLANDRLKISKADIEKTLAWKNGLFGFDHADIHTVMRQLARWYDVEVRFEGVPDNEPFQGEIGRSLTLAQVLKGLEQEHVHFRIEEDKRVIILP